VPDSICALPLPLGLLLAGSLYPLLIDATEFLPCIATGAAAAPPSPPPPLLRFYVGTIPPDVCVNLAMLLFVFCLWAPSPLDERWLFPPSSSMMTYCPR